MPRAVDKRKTRKALRRLKRVADRVEEHVAEGGKDLTAWEKDFIAGVSTRLETYGSAFRDLTKGAAEEAMSRRQVEVTRVIEKKTRSKPDRTEPARGERSATPEKPDPDKPRKAMRRTPFRRKGPPLAPRGRRVEDDMPE